MTNEVRLLPEATPRARTDGIASILRQRHVVMFGLGSAIGVGLFVGSGAAIAAAGPGVILSLYRSKIRCRWVTCGFVEQIRRLGGIR